MSLDGKCTNQSRGMRNVLNKGLCCACEFGHNHPKIYILDDMCAPAMTISKKLEKNQLLGTTGWQTLFKRVKTSRPERLKISGQKTSKLHLSSCWNLNLTMLRPPHFNVYSNRIPFLHPFRTQALDIRETACCAAKRSNHMVSPPKACMHHTLIPISCLASSCWYCWFLVLCFERAWTHGVSESPIYIGRLLNMIRKYAVSSNPGPIQHMMASRLGALLGLLPEQIPNTGLWCFRVEGPSEWIRPWWPMGSNPGHKHGWWLTGFSGYFPLRRAKERISKEGHW